MSPIASLPADQQAVLNLLLKQGKSYDELAALLRIDREVVEDRAHAALESLGPEDLAGLTDERRRELADYLLGQQSASERAATRQLLEDSASARAWARVVSSELAPIGGDALPEIPDGAGAVTADVLDAFEGRRAATPPPAGPGPTPRPVPTRATSRFGGVIVIAVLIVAVVVGIVLLVSHGGSDKTASTSPPPPPPPPASSSGNGSESVESQINLSSTSSKALAVIYVIRTQGHRTLALAGQDFPPSGPKYGIYYAVWLYNSPSDAQRLGFAPPVGTNHRLVAALDPTRMPASTAAERAEKARVTRLMASFYGYKEVVITRETANAGTRPGPIVVQGQITKPSGA
jgi:hypothetical protein